jgi:hypothetical protein
MFFVDSISRVENRLAATPNNHFCSSTYGHAHARDRNLTGIPVSGEIPFFPGPEKEVPAEFRRNSGGIRRKFRSLPTGTGNRN